MTCSHDSMDGLGLGPDVWWCFGCERVIQVVHYVQGGATLSFSRLATYANLCAAIDAVKKDAA